MPLAQIATEWSGAGVAESFDAGLLLWLGGYLTVVLLAGIGADLALFAQLPQRAGRWMQASVRTLSPGISLHDAVFFCAILFGLHVTGMLLSVLFSLESEVVLMVVQSLTLHWAALGLTVLYLRMRRETVSSFFGITLRGLLRDTGSGVTAFLAMMPVLLLGTLLYQTLLRAFDVLVDFQDVLIHVTGEHSLTVRLYLFFMAAVLAPVAEEVLFRGILLRAAVRHAGLLGGCVLTSLLFAAIHLHIPSLAPIFILSFTLSLAYLATGSLLAPITLHILFNVQSLVMMLLLRGSSG